MRILIDIGHPAHVHYFRNVINRMEKNGHEFLIVARDKEVSQILLDKYNIPYINRGKGGRSLVQKIGYLFEANKIILKEAFKFKPDIFLSFASPYAAQVSWLLRKPHISFTDTEHAKLGNLAFMPFTSVIITPTSFQKDLGTKHIKFDGFMEQTYLDKGYFTPKNVKNTLKLKNDEKYIILRFVSWGASHDIGHFGLDDETKEKLVEVLSKEYRLFISSESNLPKKFLEYKLNISPDEIHSVLANAELFIGEGATMASECAMLGTPAIYVNSLDAGTLKAQEKYENIFGFRNSKGVIDKTINILKKEHLKDEYTFKRDKLLKDSIDVTQFIEWFIEDYPNSFKIMKENLKFQNKFKMK